MKRTISVADLRAALDGLDDDWRLGGSLAVYDSDGDLRGVVDFKAASVRETDGSAEADA